ncbi:hypothetical protein FN846DRAFT_463672 [Sphaerosporella brunnea]|uniref:Uncharacterized protein n=1 Tax=Sphaerosporella brunnea TaxID=1250544 RepID=A0A5J5EEZ1_9PEZI|nr:hypothetical protein FN846DRAFT_463672 [Sphaerosporella brunnea]
MTPAKNPNLSAHSVHPGGRRPDQDNFPARWSRGLFFACADGCALCTTMRCCSSPGGLQEPRNLSTSPPTRMGKQPRRTYLVAGVNRLSKHTDLALAYSLMSSALGFGMSHGWKSNAGALGTCDLVDPSFVPKDRAFLNSHEPDFVDGFSSPSKGTSWRNAWVARRTGERCWPVGFGLQRILQQSRRVYERLMTGNCNSCIMGTRIKRCYSDKL